MRPYELNQAIQTLQAALDNHEQVNLAFFAKKLAKTAEAYPEDQTIGQISLVVGSMNNGEKLSISRTEIKDLYRRLYSRNTKFADLFGDELGKIETPKGPELYQRPEGDVELDIYQDGDKSLLAGLNVAMGNTKLAFSPEMAQEAKKVVELECSFPSMVPEVEAVSGNAECVICSASYNTPKGKAHFYVPVEVISKKATIPSIFVGKTGPKNINKKAIEQYLGDFFSVKGSYGNFGVKEAFSELEVEKTEVPEITSLVEQFDSVNGLATFEHGPKVEAGRKVIIQKLANYGYYNPQVAILKTDKTGITYGVKCNQLAFKVPVKIEAGKMFEPAVILCKGSIESFDQAGLNRLDTQEITDNSVAANVSPMHDLTPSDLVDTVRSAVGEENYAKTEDALNVLAHSGDVRAYKIAFEEYTAGLKGGMKKEASTSGSGCSRMVKSSTSTQVLCGHLNLPLNKVFQDKSGNCCPNHRKGQEEGYDGAYFMNSKIFF